jgi:hypothetical protein
MWRLPNLIDDNFISASAYGHGQQFEVCVQEAFNQTSSLHDRNIRGSGPNGKFTKIDITQIEYLCRRSTFSKVRLFIWSNVKFFNHSLVLRILQLDLNGLLT